MGQYNKAIITAAGDNLTARAVAGEIQLSITKAKTSNYKYPDNTDLKALTDMQGVKQIMESPETKVLSNDLIQTRTLFSNEEIQATYYIQNIGLYAMDGAQEVLFCIVTALVPDEMPQYNGVASTAYIYNVQSVVQDTAYIQITVHPSGVATIEDVLERVDATGGDISETVVERVELFETKFPIPSVGETIKRFLGKVLTFLKNIKPLEADVTYYVATTGSDTTGDGTSAKPYKTIQRAVDILPKDLNGHIAIIQVAAGTYDEDVNILSFHGGELQLLSSSKDTLADTCKVRLVFVKYCGSYVQVNGFTATTATMTAFITWGSHNVLFRYCQATALSSNNGIYFGESGGGASSCKIANKYSAINVVNSRISSESWAPGSTNAYGITPSYGSVVSKIGNQPTGTVSNEIWSNGGSTLNENGTQISGLVNSGLSCTWGTIKGGYVRHGNMKGPAMVTISIEVVTTASLTQGTDYAVDGFPVPIGVSVVVSNNIFGDCFVDGGTSRLRLRMPSNVASGAHLVFTATYITNS
jgi:hypothetical protein